MKAFLIAAAAVTAALSTSASANIRSITFEGDTVRIKYSDLDLSSHGGRSQLVERIRFAATRLCSNRESDISPFALTSQCYRIALTDGLNQMEAIAAGKPRD
jgi:UrcA family protein